ncbi:MAG: hypothetical protein FJW14_01760 [Acidimicrobiia bacterium]|nr:hypothetical protein [Acidimicrobiia bacterium]
MAVRWGPGVDAAARAGLEERYSLRNGEPDGGTTWRYDLGDRSRDNIRDLVTDAAVEDTAAIDREAFTVPSPTIRVAVRPLPYPFSDRFDSPLQLWQLHQSLWLLLAGASVLAASRATSVRLRRNTTVAALIVVGILGVTLPLSPAFVRMGDANQSSETRLAFGRYAGVYEIRYEAHLSYALLGRLDHLGGATTESPVRAQIVLARAASAWFLICALAVAALERWSPMIVRYVALAVLAPSALLYLGWREVGYMSLNVAAYPLLARGLRDGGWRLEAGGVLAGLGAAFHALGLVSIIGGWLAALAARARAADRVGRLLRIAAWGTAAYLGWIAVYIVVLKLPIVLGHAERFPWRPLFVDDVSQGRVNAAIFSAIGARDLAMTAWVVGAPLLLVAVSLWREHADEVRMALAYTLASAVFVICFWPIQGLNEEMDLLVAAFPALYALAWVWAHDARRTNIAAALLASGHYAFWRVTLDPQFRNAPLF